jgi:hypothetical protein
MSQTDLTPIQPPSLLASMVSDLGQHLLQIAAGSLGTWGVLDKDHQTQFVEIGMSLLMAGLAYGWRQYQHSLHSANADARVVQAAVTGVVK